MYYTYIVASLYLPEIVYSWKNLVSIIAVSHVTVIALGHGMRCIKSEIAYLKLISYIVGIMHSCFFF